jgi:hypothetical protein
LALSDAFIRRAVNNAQNEGRLTPLRRYEMQGRLDELADSIEAKYPALTSTLPVTSDKTLHSIDLLRDAIAPDVNHWDLPPQFREAFKARVEAEEPKLQRLVAEQSERELKAYREYKRRLSLLGHEGTGTALPSINPSNELNRYGRLKQYAVPVGAAAATAALAAGLYAYSQRRKAEESEMSGKTASYRFKLASHKSKQLLGLAFKIDRPKGYVKTWDQPDGSKKTFVYPVDYGYFPGIKGEDGEGLDAFVGDDPNGHLEVFQKLKPNDDGRMVLDETKFLVGVNDRQREEIYRLYGNQVWARRVFHDVNDLRDALEKFKPSKKARYTEKVASYSVKGDSPSDVQPEAPDPEKQLLLGAGGVGLGGYALSKAKPLITGRTSLYHGTSPEYVESILREGLRPVAGTNRTAITGGLAPDIREEAQKLLYLTKKKREARAYAAQAEGLRTNRYSGGQGEFRRELDQMAAMLNPFATRGVLHAEVPLWKQEIAAHLRPNPEARGSFREFYNHMPAGVDPLTAADLYRSFKATVNMDSPLDPKYIRGHAGYERLGLKELGEYVKAHPGRAAIGAGLAAAGTAGLGYGLHQIHQAYRNSQNQSQSQKPKEQEPKVAAAYRFNRLAESIDKQDAIDKLFAAHDRHPSHTGEEAAQATPYHGSVTG